MHKAVDVIDVTTSDAGGHFAGTSGDILASNVELQRAGPHANPTNAAESPMAQLATMVAKLLGADGCMIMLIDCVTRDSITFRAYCIGLPAGDAKRKQWTRHGETAAREAIRAESALLIDIPGNAGKPNMTAKTARRVHSIVASPIRVGSNIVGVLNLVTGGEICQRAPERLAAVEIAAWLVGQSLHALRLETLLDSRFAQLALTTEAGSAVGCQRLALAGSRPEQLARILAKSFFREMVKFGCESGQIITAASEIISQLSATLKRHRDRRHRKTPKSRDGDSTATDSPERSCVLHVR